MDNRWFQELVGIVAMGTIANLQLLTVAIGTMLAVVRIPVAIVSLVLEPPRRQTIGDRERLLPARI